jgi:single-stranded DNA-binding protein
MNNCNLSGQLVRNATVRGSQPRVLAFILETRLNSTDSERKEKTALIPCIIFNAAADVEEALTTGGKGMSVEFEGRLSSSSYDFKGETRHTCEVIVRSWTLTIEPAIESAE